MDKQTQIAAGFKLGDLIRVAQPRVSSDATVWVITGAPTVGTDGYQSGYAMRQYGDYCDRATFGLRLENAAQYEVIGSIDLRAFYDNQIRLEQAAASRNLAGLAWAK